MKLRDLWPFRETRADSSYTDALVTALLGQASGATPAIPTATGALEAAAGLVGRAFAAAEITNAGPATGALSPAFMALVGRSLLRRGELVAKIEIRRARIILLPAAQHDIDGGPRPDSWVYRVNLAGPDRTETTQRVPAAGVLHVTYGTDPERPWRGLGPLGFAQLAGRLSAGTVTALGDEMKTPIAHFVPIPKDGQDPTLRTLRADIKSARGDALLVESQVQDWQRGGAPTQAWGAARLGPNPPQALIQAHQRGAQEVLAACGISSALFEAADAAGAREAWRLALFSVIAPLGRMVRDELRTKLDAPDLRIEWSELRASDLQGRARSFSALRKGGVTATDAARICGFDLREAAETASTAA